MWAPATRDEALPPPHATAAAVDLTIVDPDGNRLNMGSDIDENSERMLPGYYRNQDTVTAKVIEGNREILNAVMCAAGFRRNTHEWWHFSRGDQFWALLESLDTGVLCPAIYGFARLQ